MDAIDNLPPSINQTEPDTVHVGWFRERDSSPWIELTHQPTAAAAFLDLHRLTRRRCGSSSRCFVTRANTTPDEFFREVDETNRRNAATATILHEKALHPANATVPILVDHRHKHGHSKKDVGMNVNDMFKGDWLKADAFQPGWEATYTIKHVALEKVGDDEKGVVSFLEITQGLVLNQVNSKTIASLYGFETNNWGGKQITIFRTMTDFGGKQVAAIRVRSPQGGSAPQPPRPPSAPGAPPSPPAARKFYLLSSSGEVIQPPVTELMVAQEIHAGNLNPATMQICPEGGTWGTAASFGFKSAAQPPAAPKPVAPPPPPAAPLPPSVQKLAGEDQLVPF